jgi:hypothetical protein
MPKRKTTRRPPADPPAAEVKAVSNPELTPQQLADLASAGQLTPEALWKSAGRFRRLR